MPPPTRAGGADGSPEEEIAGLRQEIERLHRQVDRSARLQALTAALGRASSLESVAEAVIAHGESLFGAPPPLLYLRDGSGEALELTAPEPIARQVAAAQPEWCRFPVDAPNPIARAARTGRPVWLGTRVDLLADWPDAGAERLDALDFVGLAALPLHDHRECIGTLAFPIRLPEAVAAEGRDVLANFTSQVGVALARVRLFDAERRAHAAETQAHERLAAQQGRLTFLAEVQRLLSSTLDSRQALRELVKATVPRLADWCTIEEQLADGQVQQLAIYHTDPAMLELAARFRRDYPAPPDPSRGVHKVLATGETDWMADVPSELLEASAQDEEHLRLIRGLELTSYAVVPIAARGHVLGALSLITERGRKLSADDVQFAEELARRAGLALENARLFEAAESSRAHLHETLMRLPAAICILRGRELRYELLNADAQRMLGDADVVGRTVDDVLTDPTWATTRDDLLTVFETGVPYFASEVPLELHARTGRVAAATDDILTDPEERYYNLVYQPMRAPSGEIDGVVTLAFEVTELVATRQRIEALAADLQRAEAEARENAATLDTLNQLAHLIAAELDTGKVVQAITDVATSLTGARFGAFFYNVVEEGEPYMLYTLSGVPRAAFSKFPMPRPTDVFVHTFGNRGVLRSDDITEDPRYGRNAPYNGLPPGHLPVRSYLAVPVVSRTGDVIGGLFLGHGDPGVFDQRAEDIVVRLSEKATLALDNARLHADSQRLIRQLEGTNRELDQFAYVTSHDLKAPLRGIASLAEWIEEDLGPDMPEGARHKLELLRKRVDRMEGLIQGILEFSRVGRLPSRVEDVDVGQLMADIVDLLAPAPPAGVTWADDLPHLQTERVALQQVLMNLISNGLKHAGRPDAAVRVSASDLGECWQFSVADNGPGIAPEFHERVWGIFQTLEPRDVVESTGIGLAVVKKIVENREGRAWIESDAGQGATFHFTWPKNPPTHSKNPPARSKNSGNA